MIQYQTSNYIPTSVETAAFQSPKKLLGETQVQSPFFENCASFHWVGYNVYTTYSVSMITYSSGPVSAFQLFMTETTMVSTAPFTFPEHSLPQQTSTQSITNKLQGEGFSFFWQQQYLVQFNVEFSNKHQKSTFAVITPCQPPQP